MKKIFIFILALCGFAAVHADEIDAVSATQGGKTDWFRFGEQNSILVTINDAGDPVFPDKTYNMSEGSVLAVFGTAPIPTTYTRTVNDGDFGTLCLPWASVKLEGGIYYDVLGTKDPVQGVALVELGESDNLTAGKPYVFLATSEQIKVTYYPETEVAEEVEGNNIIGSFDGCNVPAGMYIIYNNMLYKTADETSTIGEYRAYFDVDAMGVYTPAQAAGRRVVFMGGKTTPTDLETMHDSPAPRFSKYIMNGRLVIIRDGKEYNAQGAKIDNL